jgi:serine/threonine-protein kinase
MKSPLFKLRGRRLKRQGPILTLAAGVVLAAVLMALNLNASRTRAADQSAAGAGESTTVAGAGSPAPTTSGPAPTTAPPVVEAPTTYAGNVGGGGATIAIAVKDGKAIAYLCDGRSAEAWLQGTAQAGTLALTGAGNASLAGNYANGVATGTVTAAGREWTFSVGTVQAPSGLYRASADVANAQVVGGWIVLADGTQVGTQRQGDQVTPAPRLNLPDRTAVLNGVTVNAIQIDGTRPGG